MVALPPITTHPIGPDMVVPVTNKKLIVPPEAALPAHEGT